MASSIDRKRGSDVRYWPCAMRCSAATINCAGARVWAIASDAKKAIAKAIIGGEYEGFAKVITDATTDDTLGVHVVGPHATDLIAEASLAFQLDATAWEIGGSTHAHPTLSEVIGEAAMAVDGRSINF